MSRKQTFGYSFQELKYPSHIGNGYFGKVWLFGIDWTNKTLNLGEAKLVLDKRSHGSVLRPVVVSMISIKYMFAHMIKMYYFLPSMTNLLARTFYKTVYLLMN